MAMKSYRPRQPRNSFSRSHVLGGMIRWIFYLCLCIIQLVSVHVWMRKASGFSSCGFGLSLRCLSSDPPRLHPPHHRYFGMRFSLRPPNQSLGDIQEPSALAHVAGVLHENSTNNRVKLQYLDLGNNFFTGTSPEMLTLTKPRYPYVNKSSLDKTFPWRSFKNKLTRST
ncbi:uncharacterized protein J3R85_001742 [Psidium guajava]|nr:uncharacterized protein J3R85_001742 [Psidium guajava]